MGVQGLWELLAPVGRRVSVETLAGKKLAIDASIWMVQFMKAMRDEKGEMVRNAHLLGFFRRICKLLFLRTKPVFVFDGATPVLKRRTVIARRRQRDNAQAKVRKIAEKLLLNQLKTMKLKELVKDIEKLKQKQKINAKGEKILVDQTNRAGNQLEADDMTLKSSNQDKIDEMLAASIQAEEDRRFGNNASTSAAANIPFEVDDNEEEEMILLAEHDEVDPAVLAALPQSMQQNLLAQLKGKKLAVELENRQKLQNDDAKGKKTVSDEIDMFGCTSSDDLVTSDIQEKLDEMLAASIVAEESRSLANSASKSVAHFSSDEEVGKDYEDEDELEEMLLPAMTGEFDPNVLAALPPSMQLDLLVQMREKLMAENRQKYQKVKKDPAKFSELQIQAYLKTVAFRREIDEVQKSAAGRGVGGVQTSRIASEANREFIFSSSFTGDKQALTSTGAQRNGDKPQETYREHPSQESINAVASASKSNTMTGSDLDESRRAFDDNIETYLDERGRVRVSRVRAMGIRMTRDIQRNLDLMKEVEQEGASAKDISNTQTMLGSKEISAPRSFPCKSRSVEASHDDNSESVNLNERSEGSMLKYDTSIEISFGDDGESKCFNGDDDLFASLAARDAVEISSADNAPSSKQPSDLRSRCDWVEGITKEKGNMSDGGAETKPSLDEGNMSDESDVEWEEGDCHFHKSTSLFQANSGRTVSKGHLEEEADLQEAIRRSLEYVGDKKFNLELAQAEKNYGERVHRDIGLFDQENDIGEKLLPGQNGTQENESFCEIADGLEKPDCLGGVALLQTTGPSEWQLMSSRAGNFDNSQLLVNKLNKKFTDPSSKQSMQDATEIGSSDREMPCAESVTPLEKDVHVIAEHLLDTSVVGSGFPNSPRHRSEGNSHTSDAISAANATDLQIGEKPNDGKAVPVHQFTDIKDSTDDLDFQQKLATERKNYNNVEEKEQNKSDYPFEGNENSRVEVSEGYLGEEMQILGEEYLNLGDEQRKLERNAESVSSEMFVECQELLQMFGLPYIIAPMEAEAQCAYMELANLVDGVVTDDSDVFLFGARSVYKNIFDDRKYVETYFMKDIEKELGLTREKLIRMALLLGSDYTEGVSGIGIVNAIEVVNAFPEEDGLHKFREWIESPDPTILKTFDTETGSSAKKRGQKDSNNGLNCSKSNTEVSASGLNMSQSQQQKQSATYMQDIKQIFMDKHRNVSKNWHIPSSFPSEAVISAYSSPQVDKSTEPFTWGKPDHFVLRKLCWEKFGWANQKADELLVPVLKEYDKHETQLRLEAFYTFNERFAQIRSKRIKKAVKGITGNQTSELMDGPLQESSKTRKKRRLSPVDQSEKASKKLDESGVEDHSNYMDKSTAEQSKKGRNARVTVSSIETIKKPPLEAQGGRSPNRGSHAVGRSKGRGRGRGAGRERGKRSSSFEACKSSNADSDDDEQEVLPEKLEGPDKVRRSMRVRKPVNYTVNEFETEDTDRSSDGNDKKCSDEEAVEQGMSSSQVARGDAASGYSEKKQHNAGYSAIDCLQKDNIEVGGGFCTDEGETGRPDVGQFGDPSLEAEFSKDYLKMGGGFCSDKGEPENDQDGAHATASAAALGNADVSHRPAFVDEADADNGPDHSNLGPACTLDGTQERGKMDAYDAASNVDHPNSSSDDGNSRGRMSVGENTKDNSGMISVGGLRAMPFLKRKRRKG